MIWFTLLKENTVDSNKACSALVLIFDIFCLALIFCGCKIHGYFLRQSTPNILTVNFIAFLLLANNKLRYPTSKENKATMAGLDNKVLYILLIVIALLALAQMIVYEFVVTSRIDHISSFSFQHKPSPTTTLSASQTSKDDDDESNNEKKEGKDFREASHEGENIQQQTHDYTIFEDLQKMGIDKATIDSLPTYDELISLYGSELKIIGLETCQTFRDVIPQKNRFVGPAGMFNTGTNLMASLLSANCHIPKSTMRGNSGMRWQVPWGKHTPASWRLKHKAIVGGEIEQKDVLPVVVIKDPYTWMLSMCRHAYAANWPHSDKHCPNLIPNEYDRGYNRNNIHDNKILEHPINVNVRYNSTHKTSHDSLVGLWNDYYMAYYHPDKKSPPSYPRLMVRYEDFLLSPHKTLKTICECAGGTINSPDKFKIVLDSAKGEQGAHKGASGLISAVNKSGDASIRKKGYTDSHDLEYAQQALEKELMDAFGYNYLKE